MSTTGRHGPARALLGVGLPVGLVTLTLLPFLLFGERLPDPVATHWGGGGRPNDTMTLTFLVAFQLLLAGVPAGIMAFVARRDPAWRGEIGPAAGVTAFVATLAAGVGWLVVAANLDAATWSEAEPLGLGRLGLVLTAAVAVAAGAGVIARSIETAPAPEPRVPRAGLQHGTRAVRIGTARAV